MVKLGIIGYGGMGGYHVDRLKTQKDYVVAGIYDIDASRIALAKANGLKAYVSADELLGDPEINAVLIATPNDLHEDYVIRAANAKKHVISEKPATMTAAAFERMVAAAKRNGIIFTVHQNRRWDRDFLIAKAVVDGGQIGKVYRVESRVMGANGIPGGWRKIARQGGGMMLDWGVHLIDQTVRMFDGKVDGVDCSYSYQLGHEVEDGFDCTLEFSGGEAAQIVVDTNCLRPLPRWMIYGTEGTAVIENWNCDGEVVTPVYGNGEIEGMEAGNGFTKTMAYRPKESEKRSPLPKVECDGDAFYKNFAACVDGKAEPAVKTDEVLRVIRIMETAKAESEKLRNEKFGL